MIKLKETAKGEVRWLLDGKVNAGKMANDRLQQLLGQDARYFAAMNTNAGGFQWNTDGYGWVSLSSASESEKSRIIAARDAVHREIMSRPYASKGSSFLERIFTYPNEDYLFYRVSPTGEIEILFTGWGCVNSRKSGGGPIVITDEHEKTVPRVVLQFMLNGAPAAGYPFNLSTQGGNFQPQTTDGEGRFQVGLNVKAGTSRTVKDPATDRRFDFTVVEGKEVYEIDLSRHCSVKVQVFKDGLPLADCPVKIMYNGHDFATVTGADGTVFQRTYFYPDAECRVSVLDKEQSMLLHEGDNIFRFDFETEKVEEKKDEEKKDEEEVLPPPPPEIPVNFEPVLRVVCMDGSPAPCYPVTVNYNDIDVDFLTDRHGMVNLPEMTSGRIMTVRDGFNLENQERYELNGEQKEYIFTLPFNNEQLPRDIKIKAVDLHGRPFVGATLMLEQQPANRRLFSLDNEGACYIGRMTYLPNQDITAHLVLPDGRRVPPIHFKLDGKETEYVLQETTEQPWWYLFLEIASVIVAGGLFYALWVGLKSAL